MKLSAGRPLAISVVGDSSSSAIGLGAACWPSQLAARLTALGISHRIANYAVPGFTSADAVPLCRDIVRRRDVEVLIVYLGNNEGCRSPYKGKASQWPPRIFRRSFKRGLPDCLLPEKFMWRERYPPITVATTAEDFESNLIEIARIALRREIKLFFINPVANRNYPAGVGGSNSLYFIYPNYPIPSADLPSSVHLGVQALIQSIDYYHAGDYTSALEVLDLALAAKGEEAFVARCNRACCLAALGKNVEARALFPRAEDTPPHYLPIVLYLQALLEGSDTRYKEAYDADYSLYRVKDVYRQAVACAAAQTGACLIDLKDILRDHHFIDYCHPTELGHASIADAVALRLPRRERGESQPHRQVLVSPNYLNRPFETIMDYYLMDYPLQNKLVRDRLCRLLVDANAAQEHPIDAYLANFLAVNRRHPAFLPELDLVGIHLPHSHELLNFPEFYLYRMLAAYVREAGRRGVFDVCLPDTGPLSPIFSASEYERLILRKTSGPLVFPLLEDPQRALASLMLRLAKVPPEIFQNRANWRVRTVTYWYTRESFRYGTHSRRSMLYERWLLDQHAEGALVGLVLANQTGNSDAGQVLQELLRLLVETAACHERQSVFNQVDDYCSELKNLRGQAAVWRANLSKVHEKVYSID